MCQIPCVHLARSSPPTSAPPSPEQKRIFAAASRLFDIVTRLPPLNLCDVPRCSETAGQRSSSSRDLSRRGKHFPVNIVFPRETMPRKRPLILKLIVKVGARHTPTSPIRPANPTGFFFYFPALFQPLAPASVQQVSSSLPFARAGPTVVELCEGDRGSSSCEGAKKDARLHQSGGKKMFLSHG